ncbi:hydrogenase expression/formation protein [Methylobacter sp. S3L5C]|uniref:hydrogenase expression/formation protein n=1 Tax=Methylobacter sp. S3L5C TaxID=2839024 RepID=UPI001FABE50D|nr:hydrogenase expression/formation protein [Methylobacter sp. S3L5C]UOA08198.1 hydrogenase expression/formation protein [Methylobacter sp. S3L5C]
MAHVNTFANIPINVVITSQSSGLTIAMTLLHEIQAMLKTLLDTGQNGILDLRALPALGEDGYQFLKEKLGQGEVSARIQSFGHSEIQETAYSGIWWIVHYNQDDGILTELVEVNFLPELLKSPRDDVVFGQTNLAKILNELTEKK